MPSPVGRSFAAAVMAPVILGLAGCHRSGLRQAPGISAPPARASVNIHGRLIADSMVWSADSKRLAFTLSPVKDRDVDWSKSQLGVWDPSQPGSEASITPGPYDGAPVWLDGGQTLVLTHDTGGSRWLHTYKASTHEMMPLPRPPELVRGIAAASPCVFLDENTLLFAGREKLHRYAAWTWDNGKNEFQRFHSLSDADVFDPLAVPGRRFFVFTRRRDQERRLVVSTVTEKRTVYESPAKVGVVAKAAVSPRGDFIVYTTVTTHGDELHKLALEKTEDKVIGRALEFQFAPPSVRSTNGDIAVSALGSDDRFRIRIYDSDGRLKAESPPGLVRTSPAWSPNGEYLAYWSGEKGARNVQVVCERVTSDFPEGWGTPGADNPRVTETVR